MRDIEPAFIGRTYDDFLFRPQHGVVSSRREVSLRGRVTRKLEIELPVVSANMDSVTGERMARAVALEGGIGMIHRGMSIDGQAHAVARVKRSHGHVVEAPLCLPRTATLREAREFTRKHHVTGILIEDARGSGVLAGLLSNRDMPRRRDEDSRPVGEFMTPFDSLVVGPPDIGIDEAERRMYARRIEKLPLVDDARTIRGLITMQDITLARQRPYSSKDGKGRLLVGAATGARGDFIERAAALVEAGVDVVVIDIAHGHSDVMKEAVEALRNRFESLPLMAGNVGTGEGARFLADLGVDAIKVGIGPGRGCRTRLETAAGVPQLQAIREAWCAVGDEVPLVADGGIHDDKDIFLALACGASTVMLGSVLSGTDEAPGTVIEDPATGQKRKIYRGMTSPQAVFEALYDESQEAIDAALDTPAEGQEMQVPYKGSVSDILHRIRGHVSSAVSYGGQTELSRLREIVLPDPLRYLIPLSEAGRRESFVR